ncbi:c-type cytochrome [Chondromyces apiculatus]|uniref:Cytochrome c domain-containing protein n=1 Tax=Chondromyces apiculatus DSM 436 TaxID=1192034 RepID=A0A017TE71_9BACT|nr:cytochrome c [Chondromyces apiculatus]EYF06916.1 Hypothetical protein CAP_1174 [Chondromyces apiculatus DSM 436]
MRRGGVWAVVWARRGLLLGAVALAGGVAGCALQDDPALEGEGDERGAARLEIDLERMIYQPRYDAWEPAAVFPDGKVMRHPPEGTVPRDRVTESALLSEGLTEEGGHAARVPITLSREVLRRGQQRYDIFCALCHGVAGDGVSEVARVMTQRPPPSLVEAPIAGYAPGRVYQVIDQGYGLMRSYAADLSITDRWAVVAYVQALQRARSVSLDALPAPVRERALSELR